MSVDKGLWHTLSTGGWCNGALLSNKHIAGSCSPTSARICSRRRPADSLICIVGLISPSGTYPPPPSCPPGKFPQNQKWNWQVLCHRRTLPFCQYILHETSFGTSNKIFFSVQLPSVSSCGLYPRAAFSRSFWSEAGFLERLCNPCPQPRDEFHS